MSSPTPAAWIGDLEALVTIPSVSVDPARRRDVERAAAWVAARLRAAGADAVEVIPAAGNTFVYAETPPRQGLPTLLTYGHFDVQPVDPVDQWASPPFQPVVRGDYIYGRGASDDKGQLLAHVFALESYAQRGESPPVNLKFLLEGGEEVGSPGLHDLLLANRSALEADVAVLSDTRMLGPDRPALTYSLRGMLSCEISVRALRHDAHSGQFGGALPEPASLLARVLASLHTRSGRIALPGFYDDVKPLAPSERRYMRRHGPADSDVLAAGGAIAGAGEAGYSAYEATTVRPSLTVNGITAGYQGPGAKAVIPAVASAKLSFRLVPDQDAAKVFAQLRSHLRGLQVAGVEMTLTRGASARPVEADRDAGWMRLAARAYTRGFGQPPTLLRSGGTIPVVAHFEEVLGLPTALLGFALPGDRMHAPNERFFLPTLPRAVETIRRYWELLAARPSRAPQPLSAGPGRPVGAVRAVG